MEKPEDKISMEEPGGALRSSPALVPLPPARVSLVGKGSQALQEWRSPANTLDGVKGSMKGTWLPLESHPQMWAGQLTLKRSLTTYRLQISPCLGKRLPGILQNA